MGLNMKKQKILGVIIVNKLEIKKVEKIGISCLRTIYNDEKFSFNVLLVKSRRAFVHENVFNICSLKLKQFKREYVKM